MSLFIILEQVLAQWRRLVAFMKALDLLHWAMHGVWYHRTATAIEMVSKVDTFCIFVLFAVSPWRPPGRYGASSHPMSALRGFYESPGHAVIIVAAGSRPLPVSVPSSAVAVAPALVPCPSASTSSPSAADLAVPSPIKIVFL